MKKRILTPEEVGALLDWNPPSGAQREGQTAETEESPFETKAASRGAATGNAPGDIYRNVLEILGEAIIITDPRGCILFGNALSCHLLGKSLASIRKKPFDHSIRLADANGVLLTPSPVSTALLEHRKIPFPLDSCLLLSRGKTLSVMGSATPLLSRSGEVEGVAVSFHQTVRRGGVSDPFPSAPRREAR